MKLVLVSAAIALVATSIATPAAALPRKKKNDDPNREICESHSVLGSRLDRVRECHTAQQWEEMRQSERQGLMRKQFNGAPGCRGCDGTKDSPW